jgi:UDP-N-acetylglucosamine--N-acetylmuramyl-(pentapeptide) pyrophosphoryl-undecaprenol N-acetylglucosamine transferase
VGGSQGSEALNTLVLDAVAGVLDGRLTQPPGTQLLWGTGPANFARMRDALSALGSPSWVHPLGYIDEMPYALASTDVAVSRAGAMATSEFLAWGIPAILIPLPTAAADHQTRNAEALRAAGAALCLPQAGTTETHLWAAISDLLLRPREREAMSRAARARGRPDAVHEIARALDALLPRPMTGARR